jgi:hypothetical protein
MFTRAFTQGLFDGKSRIVEKEWKDAFASLRNSILYCHNCGSENFFNKKPTCWSCRSAITPPPKIRIGRQLIMLNHDTALNGHHIKENYDFQTVAGKISRHPTQPSKWGLTNNGTENWTYIKTNGDTAVIEPGRTAPLAVGAKINFGPAEGLIE